VLLIFPGVVGDLTGLAAFVAVMLSQRGGGRAVAGAERPSPAP
jgi:hypothetical protein